MHDELLKSALALPESERLLLATELLDSLTGSSSGLSLNDANFVAELDRRASDGSPGIAWEDVRQKLRDDLRQ